MQIVLALQVLLLMQIDNNNAPNIYTYCTASTAEGFTGLIFAMLESK